MIKMAEVGKGRERQVGIVVLVRDRDCPGPTGRRNSLCSTRYLRGLDLAGRFLRVGMRGVLVSQGLSQTWFAYLSRK